MLKRLLVIVFVFASVLPVTGCWWWLPHHEGGGYDQNRDYDYRRDDHHGDDHGYDNYHHDDGNYDHH